MVRVTELNSGKTESRGCRIDDIKDTKEMLRHWIEVDILFSTPYAEMNPITEIVEG